MIPAPHPPYVPPTAAPLAEGTEPASSSAAPAMGDGTTVASRSRRRWRLLRWPLLAVLLTVGVVILTGLLGTKTSTTPLAPDNPEDNGARAVAQVLEGQGVDVRYVRSGTEAVDRAGPGRTVLVVNSHMLADDVVEGLVDSGADLALFEPNAAMLDAASGGLVSFALAGGPESEREASCESDAVAGIDAIMSSGAGVRLEPEQDGAGAAAQCFAIPGETDAWSFIDFTRADARVQVLDDQLMLTNPKINEADNAALVLRMLGHNESLIWVVPEPGALDSDSAERSGLLGLLPDPTLAITILAGVVFVALMFWRGRRLGPVVTEPLPVLVRSAEATRGRARLYRRASSYGHAAAALRAGAADRLAARVGLPRSATATDLLDALTRATDHPTEHIGAILYGPPPTNDSEFVRLSAALDQLENEVYHP